mgnify:CR=1 FL=1
MYVYALMGSSREVWRKDFRCEFQYMVSINYYGELLLANKVREEGLDGGLGNMAEKWTRHRLI